MEKKNEKHTELDVPCNFSVIHAIEFGRNETMSEIKRPLEHFLVI